MIGLPGLAEIERGERQVPELPIGEFDRNDLELSRAKSVVDRCFDLGLPGSLKPADPPSRRSADGEAGLEKLHPKLEPRDLGCDRSDRVEAGRERVDAVDGD